MDRAQLQLAELIAEGRVLLADGTLIGCANCAGCASKSHFACDAAYGYCPSKSQFIWGMRLVLMCDRNGVPPRRPKSQPETPVGTRPGRRPSRQHPLL